MPYSAAGKNLMLAALSGVNPSVPITHVGLFDEAAAITGVTGVASTDVFAKTTHGLINGNLVVLRAKTGGAGIFTEHPYFVINANTDDFQLAKTPSGSAINFSTDISVLSVVKLVEIAGGSPSYARKAIAYNAPASGAMDDSTNGAVFDIPAGATVNYVGYFSASSAGTLLAIDSVTAESFSGQGTYTLTDSDLDLNGDEV